MDYQVDKIIPVGKVTSTSKLTNTGYNNVSHSDFILVDASFVTRILDIVFSREDMMEATVAVIFIVCFASNGGPVKSDVPEQQEKFRNLLNSVANHDQVEFNINREGLREQAIHERQAFDSMKDALRITPRRSTANRENPARSQRRHVPPNSNPAAPELTAEKEQQVTITSAERQTDLTSPSPKFSEGTTQRLPEQDADWRTIRGENFLYVDKTPYLVKLLERGGKLRYVTRPRRFGKSSFLDMAADYFRGKEDLFRGLAVEDVGNTKFFAKNMPKTRGRLPKWKEFPVIHLNFGRIESFKTGEEFKMEYRTLLERVAVSYKLDHTIWSSFGFGALVEALRQKFNNLPVFVLVDEYDHPFQYAFLKLNKKVAKAVRTELSNILTTIKNDVGHLGLALVTGVSKLGLVALESTGTEAFVDLTNDKDLAQAFGLTETEITSQMGPNLRYWARNTAEKTEPPSDDSATRIMADLVKWYDGYQFALVNESCKVLNPISTIQSVKNQRCANYWTSTGSLAHLVDQFYREKYTWDSLEKGISTARENLFLRIDPSVSSPPLPIWMFMFGYYTISSYDKTSEQVTLKFPNKEIKETLEFNIAMYIPGQKKFIHVDFKAEIFQLQQALRRGDTKRIMEILKSFVLTNYGEPLNLHTSREEATRRMALILKTTGVEMENCTKFQRDDDPSRPGGDIDLQTVDLPINYVFETKCSTNLAENALTGLGQQMGYLRNHPTNFFEANKKKRNYNIVSVNFLLKDRLIELVSWIAVPCVDGFVQFPDTLAAPKELKKRFLGNYQVDKQSSEYIKLRCGPELPKPT